MTEELTTGELVPTAAATETEKGDVSSSEQAAPEAVDATGAIAGEGAEASREGTVSVEPAPEESVNPDGLLVTAESVETAPASAPTIAEAGGEPLAEFETTPGASDSSAPAVFDAGAATEADVETSAVGDADPAESVDTAGEESRAEVETTAADGDSGAPTVVEADSATEAEPESFTAGDANSAESVEAAPAEAATIAERCGGPPAEVETTRAAGDSSALANAEAGESAANPEVALAESAGEVNPEGLLVEAESVEIASPEAPTIAEAGEATSGPLTADELAVKAPPIETDRTRLKAVIEAVIYITDEPLSTQQIAGALSTPIEEIKAILDELTSDYAKADRGLSIREVAGGFKMATKPEHHEEIRAFVKNLKPPLKLSLAALETLAVIAYKQPITAPEIMEIRGVQGAGVLKTLLDRKLIATAGRKNVIGKPILYKTTKEFLVQFGLKDLAELPTLKEFEELGRLALSDSDAEPGGPPASEPGGQPPMSDPDREPEPPAGDPSPEEPPQQEPPSEPAPVEEPPPSPDEPNA